MRRARIDLLQHLVRLHRIGENRQRREVAPLSRQPFKFFLLTLRSFARPDASSIAGDCFNSPRPRRDRFFLDDPERAYLAGRPYMSATAKLHRVAVQFLWLAADLNDTDLVAVFLTKKLPDLFAFLRFRIRNFCPRNRSILSDLFVHQLFYIALLLRRERCAREVERQFVRPDVTALLCCIPRDNFMQRPVEQMRPGVVTFDDAPPRGVDAKVQRFFWGPVETFNISEFQLEGMVCR